MQTITFIVNNIPDVVFEDLKKTFVEKVKLPFPEENNFLLDFPSKTNKQEILETILKGGAEDESLISKLMIERKMQESFADVLSKCMATYAAQEMLKHKTVEEMQDITESIKG